MEMRVPIFAGRRILKKESLWDIRDYTYAGWQLYYAEYTDGLLKGCDIRWSACHWEGNVEISRFYLSDDGRGESGLSAEEQVGGVESRIFRG